MERRRALVAAAAVVTTLIVAGCSSSGGSGNSGSSGGGGAPAGTIKIGVIEPFSGPFGYFGQFVANSMKIEVDKINKAGGLLGHKLQIVTRDDKLAAQDTVSAVREFAADPSIGMVEGPSFTALYNAAKPIYEQNKKVNCQPAVDDTDAIKGATYTFRTGVYNKVSDAAILAYLANHTDVKTIGLVYSKDATGQSIDGDLKTLAPKYGLKYLGVKYFNEGAQNQLSQVSALKDADAIYVSGNATDASETALSAKQVGYKGILVGNNGLQGFTYVEGSQGAADGTIYSSNNLDYDTTIPSSQWPTAYREHVEAVVAQYGETTGPASGVKEFKGTTISADCVVEWAAAVKKANSFDPAKVAGAWANLSLPASQVPSGIAVHFTPDDHDEYQSADQLFIYKWVKQGPKKWGLTQLLAPSK